MSDDFNDAAIISHAEDLFERARDDADFCAGVLLAAAQMLAFPGNRAEISANIKCFTAEVWNASAEAQTAMSAAESLLARSLLARIRRAEGGDHV
jgi:hypothetical protein